MSSDLARVEEVQLEQWLESARTIIARLGDFAAIRDIANRAAAAAEYCRRAKETRHLVNQATEVRVWAERRAGELLLLEENGAEDISGLARRFGTNGQTLRRWFNLAHAPEEAVEIVLAELQGTDGDITVTGVARRLQTKGLTRVERGIYRNYLGKYVLRWRRDGVSRQLTFPGDLRQARQHLLVVTGKAPKPLANHVSEWTPRRLVEESYSTLRADLLPDLDRALADSDSRDIRVLIEEAIAGLHRAEDALTTLLREPDLR